MGQTPRTELLALSVITPSEDMAEKMRLAKDQKIIPIFRRKFADDTSLVTIRNFIPYELGASILNYDFKAHSLYDLLSSNPATKIKNTRTIVSANPTSVEDITLLNATKHASMLYFHNVAVKENDTGVDFAFSHYRGDLNKFEHDAVP